MKELENLSDIELLAYKEELSRKVSKYNNIQTARKLSMNSLFGSLGTKYFRFYDLRMALAITLSSQLSIRWIILKINEYMNRVLGTTNEDFILASDTDSFFLHLEPLITKVGIDTSDPNKVIEFMDKICKTKIQETINKSYQELADYVNAYEQKMSMKREALADKGIWTAKKRYILNVYNNEGIQFKEPHLKTVGLEVIKSSTPNFVRQRMKQLIKLIMTADEDTVQKFIANFKSEFRKLSPEDIAFPRGVNNIQGYSDSRILYKSGTPIHVKGAILYNDFLIRKGLDKKYPKIQSGDKIKFIYLKKPNPLKNEVISFPIRLPIEFELHDYIDRDKQFHKTFIDPISVILNCIGWKSEKTFNLDDFFD